MIIYKNIQGDSKKTQEFSHITRTVVACEPCHGFTNRFFLRKTEIQTQILNTEKFLCNLMGLRYQQNKMGFSRICQCDKLFTFSFELLHILKDGWNENNYKTSWSVLVTWGLRVLIRGYQGHSGASPRSVRVSWGFSEAATATVGEYEYEFFAS